MRIGFSSGPPDGEVLFNQGGFEDISRYVDADLHPPVCEGDWVNRELLYLPGKPTQPGAY